MITVATAPNGVIVQGQTLTLDEARAVRDALMACIEQAQRERGMTVRQQAEAHLRTKGVEVSPGVWRDGRGFSWSVDEAAVARGWARCKPSGLEYGRNYSLGGGVQYVCGYSRDDTLSCQRCGRVHRMSSARVATTLDVPCTPR